MFWAMIRGLFVFKKLAGMGLVLTPLGAMAGPVITSIASVLGEVIKAFGRGIAVTVANPAVILVILAASGSAYVYANGAQNVLTKKAEAAVIVMRDQVEARCPPATAAKIRRAAGVRPKPKPAISEWVPPGLNPF
jgi:hypothetical protein